MGCKMDKQIDHMQTKAGRTAGFTLIEALIAVAIVSILAAVALPAYQQQVAKGRRSAAETFMFNVASKQEQFLLDARKYATTLAELNLSVPAEVARFYTVTFNTDNAAVPPSYSISAAPMGGQEKVDAKCGTLQLVQNGAKSASTGSTSCW